MLLKCIKTEAAKLSHSYLWLVFLAVPVLPTMMGTGNYKMNLGLLTEGWYSLWTQQSLFYASFFYGPLIALYCSYTWRVEHLNYNWNHLMTMPVPERDIFGGKLILAMGCTVGLQLWIWILYILAGKLSGLPGQSGRPGRHGFAACAFHDDSKLCGSDCFGAAWKRSGNAALQRRLWSFLALFADDDGNERQ